jgi:hypothetical protein
MGVLSSCTLCVGEAVAVGIAAATPCGVDVSVTEGVGASAVGVWVDGSGVSVGEALASGAFRVLVEVGTEVLVGGTGVLVGVGVEVDVGDGVKVLVGGTAVSVGVEVLVGVEVVVDVDVAVGACATPQISSKVVTGGGSPPSAVPDPQSQPSTSPWPTRYTDAPAPENCHWSSIRCQ